MEQLIKLALDCGFTESARMDAAKLVFRDEVREMCAADKCHLYGRSWRCPPACGTLDEMRESVKKYSRGLLMQTVWELEDSFDFEGMGEAARVHNENFERFIKAVKAQYPGALFMGAGGCMRCAKCTYPDEPCRFPDDATSSMEACGLLVSQVCVDNGVKYNYGANRLAYTACALID